MAFQHFGLVDFASKPTSNAPPILHQLRDEKARYLWLIEQAKSIRRKLMSPEDDVDLEDVAHAATTFDQRDRQLQDMLLDNGRYKCTHCDRTYVTKGGVVRHLKKVHGVDLDLDTVRATTTEEATSARAIVASFSRMAFLYRDTSDSYRMADGDRIFRNAKLEMLYAYSLKHTKYRLWLWRMLSYELAILSPCEAFDYKWNTCTNLQGGIGRNIPNDNAVELQVGEIKKRLQREGSNKSFESAQLIC